MMNTSSIAAMIRNNGQQFKRIFNVPINQFVDFTGFDIVKFDSWLKTPENESCAAFLERQYGLEAKKLVERLIAGEKL